jgi:DNA invertase Pin-like site-specific DNA recombinase
VYCHVNRCLRRRTPKLIGSARISRADGSQSLDLQRDALTAAGVDPDRIFEDRASGRHENRPGLQACLKTLRLDDTLVVWKLDRLGRDLARLVATVRSIEDRCIGFRVLAGRGAGVMRPAR